MDKRPQQGDTFPLTIDGYASDGSGVGRLEGMVVFVPGALRGEVCQVQLTHVGRSALWGRVKTILTPSPARIPPDCPYDAQCGGCRFSQRKGQGPVRRENAVGQPCCAPQKRMSMAANSLRSALSCGERVPSSRPVTMPSPQAH